MKKLNEKQVRSLVEMGGELKEIVVGVDSMDIYMNGKTFYVSIDAVQVMIQEEYRSWTQKK